MAQRRPLRRHPVAVPPSLRVVVRARRSGWRVCLAPGGAAGLLAPMAWPLVMVLVVVLGAVGLAIAAAPFVNFVRAVAARDASDAVGAAFVMIVMPIMGGLIGCGAVRLGRPRGASRSRPTGSTSGQPPSRPRSWSLAGCVGW